MLDFQVEVYEADDGTGNNFLFQGNGFFIWEKNKNTITPFGGRMLDFQDITGAKRVYCRGFHKIKDFCGKDVKINENSEAREKVKKAIGEALEDWENRKIK